MKRIPRVVQYRSKRPNASTGVFCTTVYVHKINISRYNGKIHVFITRVFSALDKEVHMVSVLGQGTRKFFTVRPRYIYANFQS